MPAVLHGVNVRNKPEINLHRWLDPAHPEFNRVLYEAIFYYMARTSESERLKVCIATPAMNDAAWRYGHHAQIVLDGTFGICSVRMLLFISLAIDENGKGIPLAFFLFSAPSGNRATHAGYNTDILYELLDKWRRNLSNTRRTFIPYVAITDTDTKERGALLRVWPDICLLLCKFHLRQCWTNQRKRVLSNTPQFWKGHVEARLRALEVRLIESVDHSSAVKSIQFEQEYLQQHIEAPESQRAAQGGLRFLIYLTDNWMSLPLWQSWSQWGRVAAAAIMKIPVDGVIPTTNHLESFNGILKRKHLPEWLHSGHRLRFDTLIHFLVTEILPGVFSARNARAEYAKWLVERFRPYAEGQNLAQIQSERENVDRHRAWWEADSQRDTEASVIVNQGKLANICRSSDNLSIHAACLASDPRYHYDLTLSRTGVGSCSCPDFKQRGGACKHMRALRLVIEYWVQRGIESPYYFPPTLAHARQVSARPASLQSPPGATTLEAEAANRIAVFSNWQVLQSLAADSTTLEEHSISDEENSDDDTYKNPFISQGGAIIEQVQQHIEHGISQVLPTLHGLSELLNKISQPDLSAISTIPELDMVIKNIGHKLNRSQITTDVNLNTSSLHPLIRRQSVYPSLQLRLLPPSPEHAQKRKKSYGVY
ncbi:hypothetical protein CCMSSC00406_0007967 [Pleurotus cornucopiae]|uniref:Uncharacterized protein n=1 Tax=Pleurotus cornucopiae TaxID=5321 RepID=A0ACB7IJQ0_PLECO|nr:hypothetical protein CCMSSC00406_0007967 [Pleurotus cornucopiae]